MAEAELRDSTERALEVYGKPLETVATFKYLGRVMTADDDNWPAVAGNFMKARKSWVRLSRILIVQEGIGKLLQGGGAGVTTDQGGDVGADPNSSVLSPSFLPPTASHNHLPSSPAPGT